MDAGLVVAIAVFVGFGLTWLGLLVAVFIRFFMLSRMDEIMSVSDGARLRRPGRKMSFMPFSVDVITEYGMACSAKCAWNRRYSDLDPKLVPRAYRWAFATATWLIWGGFAGAVVIHLIGVAFVDGA